MRKGPKEEDNVDVVIKRLNLSGTSQLIHVQIFNTTTLL